MEKLLAAMFVALLMVGCDGTDRVGRELREGFSRKHNKGSAEKRRQERRQALDGIKAAEENNATEISILYNSTLVGDVTPLAGLTNLKKLELQGWRNPITDLTPLAGLTNLERLGLAVNKITDLTPLAGLTNLTKLHLEDNPIPLDQMAMLRKALPNCKIYFMRPFRP